MLRIIAYTGLVLGLLGLTALVLWQGVGEILHLLQQSGPALLLLPLVWIPSQMLYAWSWQLLFPPGQQPRFGLCLWATWMGRAVNNLLPVAQLGGEVVKARALVLRGTPAVDAAAAAVVDKTAQVLAMFPWAMAGVVSLLLLQVANGIVPYVLAGMALLGLGLAGFIVVQRAGLFHIFHALAGNLIKAETWQELAPSARAVDLAVVATYMRRRLFTSAVVIKFAGWVLQTTEVWLGAYLLGQPLTFVEALMLKSLSSVISDLAFVIPNAYGVQEGAYVMLGALLGLPPPFMLALSLATRVRELLIDLPGLLLWQHLEASTLWRKRASSRT